MEFSAGPERTAPDARGLDGDGHALNGDAALNRAKGVLMLRYGVGSHEALALLLHSSRQNGMDLRNVATTLVDEIHEGAPADLTQWLDDALQRVLPGEWR